jgi:DNA topoisomerase-1
MDVKFTAKMESLLDNIEEGKVKWNKVIEEFYTTFSEDLEKAKKSMDNLKKKGIETDVLCELCGKPMVIKSKGSNEFLACSGYPDCKNIKNFEVDKTGKISVIQKTVTDKKCPKCGGNLVVKRGPYSNFLGCENYPKCKYTEPILLDVPCPKGCGGYVVERRTKKGRVFYGCSNYPKCDFIINQKPINEKCPLCGSSYLLDTMEKRVPVIKCPEKDCGYKRQK